MDEMLGDRYANTANSMLTNGTEFDEFVRDEMANIVWAVEHIVESAAGFPLDRHEVALTGAQSHPVQPLSNAALRYRIATTTPAHWIPMLPVSADGQLMLERGEMLPDYDAGGQTPTKALGEILDNAGSDLRVFEEEVPRSGIRVTRAYQYTRWLDGSTHVWIGRLKQPAKKDEARSGWRFDSAEAGAR